MLMDLARHVRDELARYAGKGMTRQVLGDSPGGDAQFDIDRVAENAIVNFLRDRADRPLAVYTEDGSLVEIGDQPETLLVIDPIDGTRPASAGLEMAMISIAAAPLGDRRPTLSDVNAALLMDIKNGSWIYGDDAAGLSAGEFEFPVPRLSRTTSLSHMFWSIEFNGHPMHLMSAAYSHLVDRSANAGAVFVFNSATYSISRIITGQLDAYVDIGNRLLKDHPWTEADFRASGRGSILHLFPYDIAAAVYLARQAGVVITDGYGNDLGSVDLLDLSPANQRSCVAAATAEMHKQLLDGISWDLPAIDRLGARHPRHTGEDL